MADAFLNLLPDPRKRIMAKLMAEKYDIESLDRMMANEGNNVINAYNSWKKTARPPVASNSTPGDPTPKPSPRSVKEPMKRENQSKKPKQVTLDLTDILQSLHSTEDGGGTKMDDPSILPTINPTVFKKMPKELTVVFLGETGVGKSTFINGLANYLKHATMYDAMKKGVDILIKSYFTYTDDNYQRTEIRCDSTIQAEDGSDVVNEHTEAGQSSTQHPKCYRFVWNYGEEQKVIRIIDTPGVGDVRGVQQEKENFQRILSFLADFKEINAICILLKPNDSKLTVTFRYCISELLTHLHVSAATNILFCFTNARATLYRPGDTLPTLESYLKTLKEERKIKIECNQDTLFSFDNESFRFLCALMHGAKFTEKEKDNFNGSWVKSVEETFRLFSRISELRVHDVNKTLSINNIRSVILAMARPLAEIARNQLLNSQLIQDKINEIEDRMKVKDSLKGRLHVDQVVISTKPIDFPVTVCTAAKCVEHMRFSQNPTAPMETIYKTQCHKKCYLDGIEAERVPHPGLQKCWALYNNIEKCKTCECPWTTHMHIRYTLVKNMERVVDPTVQKSIQNKEDEIKTARLFIEKETLRKEQLLQESTKITKSCSDFAAFLNKNCLLPYNDAYKDYVDHLIKEERDKGSQNRVLLEQLQAYREQYEEQLKILKTSKNSNNVKSIEQIYQMVDELKKLKHSGALLQEIENVEILSVRKQQLNRSMDISLNGGWMENQKKTQTTNSPTKPLQYKIQKLGTKVLP